MLKLTKLLFLTLLICKNIFAQSYHFVPLTVDDGLSQNEIVSIIQDKRGLIWMATKGGGVTIFDGINYRYLKEENGLSNNIVYCLFEDLRGNIWIGTYDGLNLYDGVSIKTFNEENGLNSTVIKTIAEDATGRIWVGTENGGISVLNPKSKNFQFEEFNIVVDKYIGNSFRKIIESSDGKMWLAGNKGVTVIDGNKTYHYVQNDGLAGNYVFDLHEDINGDIVIATNNGLSIFDGKTFTNYSTENGFPSNDILCIEEDQKGNLWLGTAGDGLIKFNPLLQEYEIFNSNNGLSEDIVLCVLEDFSNNIWVGTKGGGVNRFSGVAFTYFTTNDGLISEKVNAIAIDKKNQTWFATREGLIKFDGENHISFTQKNGLPVNFCSSVFEDKKGNIWVGTLTGLVKIVNDKITNVYSYKEGVMNPVVSIIEDKKGNIWLGTDGGGIILYDGVTFKTYSMINGLNSNKVTSVLEDDKGAIWVGTFGGGVAKFNGTEFINYEKEDGLASNIVYSLAKGPRGEIYVGTKNGITRIENKIFTIFDTKSGLISNNIKMLAFDEENSLWVGSEKGLDRIYFNPPQVFRQTKKAISEIKHYGKDDGIKGGEINSNAVAQDADGNMWFGTNKGSIKFDINVDDYNLQKPKTYITDLKLEYNSVDWLKKGFAVFPWTNTPKNLELHYDSAHVTFSFIGINHKSPDKVRYQWKLEGFDQSFTPLTAQNFATYPNLPPGNYTFIVIACNSDEECNDEEPATFSFVVKPPFWQELWFISLMSFFGILIIFVTIKYRERKLRKDRERLELSVKERTQEVVEKNNQLELVNLEIVSKNKEIEEKNSDLNSSIRYALTIQQASFPSITELTAVFPDAFIFHLPRDIVSGDFYWYRKIDNLFVIAIADCTGHGVPGAFMSMLGMTLLNEIFSGKEKITAGEALNRLDAGIVKAFENSDTESKDGMDIALCIIDKQHKTIEFSGAYRPMVMIKNNEIIEIKGTKYAIGSKDIENKNFENNVYHYEDGECMYLFSDGYPDQFGGTDNKKFKTKVMKEMFLEIHPQSMHEQKLLIHNRLKSWMGKYEQVDDILISGIRL